MQELSRVDRIIRLLNKAKEIKNVSLVCKEFGFSRDSYYRFKKLYEKGGEEALKEKNRKIIKKRKSEIIEETLINIAKEHLDFGKKRLQKELENNGIFVSQSTIRSILVKNALETVRKRKEIIFNKISNHKIKPSSKQFRLYNENKNRKLFELNQKHAKYPFHIGLLDILLVSNLKKYGRIYQYTFQDAYSCHVITKLYNKRSMENLSLFLKTCVFPFIDQHNIMLKNIFHDDRTEFVFADKYFVDYGFNYHPNPFINSLRKRKIEQEIYSRFYKRLCFVFHELIKKKFYKKEFSKEIQLDIKKLQIKLNKWTKKYNEQFPNNGIHCNGATPLQTMLKALHLSKQNHKLSDQ